MTNSLRDIPLDEAPELDSWLDLSELAVGFDVLSKEGEVALIIHMPEGVQHIGVTFDVQGATQLALAIAESALSALEAD